MKAVWMGRDKIRELPVHREDTIKRVEREAAWDRADLVYQHNRQFNLRTSFGVYLFTGGVGAGKTTIAAVFARMAYGKGVPVFSNISTLFGYHVDVLDLYLFATKAPPYSVLIVDELHAVLSRYRQSSLAAQQMIQSLAAVRKRRLTILGCTAQEFNVSTDFKASIDMQIYPRRRYNIPEEGARDSLGRFYPGWAHVDVDVIGPKPYRGRTLGDEWGIDVYGGEVKKRTLSFPPALIYEAACLQFSFEDIPFGESAGVERHGQGCTGRTGRGGARLWR